MSSAPSVTVVVPARDAAHLIGRQLDALAAQTAGDFEVVVADNGSSDGTAEVARRWEPRLDVRVVDASERPGVSHARNVGARAARADKILFCDADDEVDHGWVSAMSDTLDAHDVVAGRLDLERINPDVVLAAVGPRIEAVPPVSMRFLPYGASANLGVRREVFDRTGGFDEDYRSGHEDVEFCWRAQIAGFGFRYTPSASVNYRLRPSTRAMARQRYRYGRSYAQLYRDYRHHGVPPTPLRDELRFYARLLRSLPRDLRSGGWGFWFVTAAWNAGRLAGDLRYRTRCPL